MMHVSDGESESRPLNLTRKHVKTDRCAFVVTKYFTISFLASMLNFKEERMNLGGSSSKSTSTTSRIQNWTRERDTCLVGIMRQRFDAGDWANGSFTKNAWRQIVEDYNYANMENQVTLSQILNRWKVLKKEFNCFFNLRNKSGWGWDYERHCPVAPDRESWMQLEECYRKIRGKTFPHFSDMEAMVGRDIARGSEATVGVDDPPNAVEEEIRLGDDTSPLDNPVGTNTQATQATQATSVGKRTSASGTSSSKRRRNSGASAEEIKQVEEIKHLFSQQLIHQEKSARRDYASEEIQSCAETLGRMCPEITGSQYFHVFWKLQDPNFRDLFKVARKDDQLFYHFIQKALDDFDPSR